MNHAVGVRLGEPLAGLEDDVHRVGDGKRLPSPEHLGEILTLQQLHDHEGGPPFGRAHVHHATDVRVVQLEKRTTFAAEPRGRLFALHELGEQQLDRDAGSELEVRRFDHHPHPATPEHLLHAVLVRDDGARGHLFGSGL